MAKASREPFTGTIILLFALASYRDGTFFVAGVCTGVGGMMIFDWAMSRLDARSDKNGDRT